MAVNVNSRNTNDKDEVFFEIKSYIGVLAEYQTGWKKEVNVVSWNGANPKFDIRDWSPDHDRMSRGITLHEEEARKLAAHLAERFMKSGDMDETRAVSVNSGDVNQAVQDSDSVEPKSEGAETNVGVAEKESPGNDGCICGDEEHNVEDEKIPA